MNLDLFNNLLNEVKGNNIISNFIKELSNYLEKANNSLEKDLKQENCLYQVIDINDEGVYLQNTNNNKVSKETNIDKEILDKIGQDSILRYKDGKYIYEEELTERFMNSLIGIKEYNDIKDNFIKNSNIQKINENTKFKIDYYEGNYCILTYENNVENKIKVPKELIPFWTKNEEYLVYKDGKFNRDI